MIIKSASLMYLFDFDGTVAGSDDWGGYIKNCLLSFRQLHINPGVLDIRWCILTSRPKIDKLLVHSICKFHNIHPEIIFTSPTLLWKFKNVQQEVDFKEKIIKDILDNNIEIGYTPSKITKICYIDNNDEMVIKLNSVRGDYKFLAMSVADLINRDFMQLLLD